MVPIASAAEVDRTAPTEQNKTAQGNALGNPSQTFFEPCRGEIRLRTGPPGTVRENFRMASFRSAPRISYNTLIVSELHSVKKSPAP